MNLEQLKAHAYDCLHNIEVWQNKLKATNNLIAKYKENPLQDKEVTEPTTGTNEEGNNI